MAFTFSCPNCLAVLHLPDEAAGQSGQCPRCQALMRIPSSTQPRAVVIDPQTGMPKEPATPAARQAPTSERGQPSRRQPRPSTPAVPPKPTGPVWPTAVGIVAGLICMGLLFASVVTLFSVRGSESLKPKTKIAEPIEDVRVGRLDGRRAVLQNGFFHLDTRLAANDDVDPDQINCRCKRFEIELRRNQTYVIELDSPNFDCVVRVETPNNQVLDKAGGPGHRHATLTFTPGKTELHAIYVTSDQPAFGPLKLTITEFNGGALDRNRQPPD